LREKENNSLGRLFGEHAIGFRGKTKIFFSRCYFSPSLKDLKEKFKFPSGLGCEMLPSQPAFAQLIIRRAMNLKQFLKPDWRKIVIFMIFFALSYIYTVTTLIPALGLTFLFHGFPLGYFRITVRYNVIQASKILWVGLLADIIFWYLLSCLIIWIYDKLKKKKPSF